MPRATRHQPQARQLFRPYQPGAVPIRHICRMRHYRQQQPRRIYRELTLASQRFFAGIIAARPLFR